MHCEMSMNYKLVIFDFDGTLADSFPWFLDVINVFADRYKFRHVEESEIETLRGYEAGELLKYLGVPLWRLPKIAKDMRALMAEQVQQIPLFDGVALVLERLSQAGGTLAVVSSNASDIIRKVLGPENAAHIAYYECGVAAFGKSAKLRKVLGKSGALPDDAIYIGDEIRDLEAARQEHMAFGAVSWGYTRADAFETRAPTMIFETVDQIVDKLI